MASTGASPNDLNWKTDELNEIDTKVSDWRECVNMNR